MALYRVPAHQRSATGPPRSMLVGLLALPVLNYNETGLSVNVAATVTVSDAIVPKPVIQEGFRWRNDDGSETTATWKAAQDTNVSLDLATAARLRVLLDTTANPPALPYTLYYKKSTDSVWAPVPVGPAGVTFTDDFNRADGAVGSNYETPVIGAMTISTNRLRCTGDPGGFAAFPTATAFTAATNAHQVTATYLKSVSTADVQAFLIICGNGTWVGDLNVPAGYYVQCIANFARLVRDNVEAVGHTAIPGYTAYTDVTMRLSHNGSGQVKVDADYGSGWVNAITYNDATPLNRLRVGFGFAALPSSGTGYIDNVTAEGFGGTAPSGPVYIATSSNITTSGEATTAQLTAPSGKTTAEFSVGRMWDDENGTDTVDI